MATESTKPLDPRCRYIVREVTRDEVTEEVSYVLAPIAEYPIRQIKVGDIFQPVGYASKAAR